MTRRLLRLVPVLALLGAPAAAIARPHPVPTPRPQTDCTRMSAPRHGAREALRSPEVRYHDPATGGHGRHDGTRRRSQSRVAGEGCPQRPLHDRTVQRAQDPDHPRSPRRHRGQGEERHAEGPGGGTSAQADRDGGARGGSRNRKNPARCRYRPARRRRRKAFRELRARPRLGRKAARDPRAAAARHAARAWCSSPTMRWAPRAARC